MIKNFSAYNCLERVKKLLSIRCALQNEFSGTLWYTKWKCPRISVYGPAVTAQDTGMVMDVYRQRGDAVVFRK